MQTISFSDDRINEFLCQNKDLFSTKREFLTKLREVRQKLMNTNILTQEIQQEEIKNI